MGRKCFVPGCKSGYDSEKKRLLKTQTKCPGLFKPPRDWEMLEIWRKVIPRADKLLTENDSICELHFAEDDIEKYFVTSLYDGNIFKMERMYPRLKPGAIPVCFPNLPRYSKNLKKIVENRKRMIEDMDKDGKESFKKILEKRKLTMEELETVKKMQAKEKLVACQKKNNKPSKIKDVSLNAENTNITANDTNVVAEDTNLAAEDTYIAAENTYIVAEDTYIAAEDMYIATEDIVAKDTYIAAEDTCISVEDINVGAEDINIAEDTNIAVEELEVIKKKRKKKKLMSYKEELRVVRKLRKKKKLISHKKTKKWDKSKNINVKDNGLNAEITNVIAEDINISGEARNMHAEITSISVEHTDTSIEKRNISEENGNISEMDEITFNFLVKNLEYISKPDSSWAVSAHDKFVMCAKWTQQYSIEKKVIIDCDLKIKVYVKDKEDINFKNLAVSNISDISTILHLIDS